MRKISKFLMSLLFVIVFIGGTLGIGVLIYLNQDDPVVLEEKPSLFYQKLRARCFSAKAACWQAMLL